MDSVYIASWKRPAMPTFQGTAVATMLIAIPTTWPVLLVEEALIPTCFLGKISVN